MFLRNIFFVWLALFTLPCVSASPERFGSEEEPEDSLIVSTLSLIFAGDLMQHQGQIDCARTTDGHDYSTCFAAVKEEIRRADIAIANLEVTLGGKPYKGYPCFSAPDEFVYAAQEAGFNLLLTSNNHSLDRGKAGLERTIQVLDSLEIMHVGTYIDPEEREQNYPLLVEQNNFRLVFPELYLWHQWI